MTETNHSTDLDKELQRLATGDWEAFVQLIGEETITYAKICLLKSKGKSLGQISTKMNKTKSAIRWASKKKCSCIIPA